MSSRPRVLLLSTSLGMGGADRQILYLARALLANGFEVRLVSMTPLLEMGQQAVVEGLPITSLEMNRGQADWGSFQRFVTILRDWRPHVLTTFMYHANLLGRLAGRWAGVPVIVTSIRSERNGSAARDWLMRVTNWMDDSCTTNSREVAESLRKRHLLPGGGKASVIANGVDTTAMSGALEDRERIRNELGLAAGTFLWLAVGRLWEQKDYPTMLQAFQPLAATPARLAIAGRGPLLDPLKLQARQLGIAHEVTFLGVRNDIPSLLGAADGFVLSSAWEGMPNVVMEALAAGVPVVATRVGGVPELVDPGKSGFVVPPRNPAALSEAMHKLMTLPADQLKEMGQHGRRHIDANYGMSSMAKRWIGLFEALLMRKGIAVSHAGGLATLPEAARVARPHA